MLTTDNGISHTHHWAPPFHRTCLADCQPGLRRTLFVEYLGSTGSVRIWRVQQPKLTFPFSSLTAERYKVATADQHSPDNGRFHVT